MKKTYRIIAISFAILMLFTGGSIAGTLDSSDRTLETTTAGAAYPDLADINVSPNVELGYFTEQDAFAVTGFNLNGTIQYGVASDSANIFFTDATDATAVVEPTAADSATAFADYAALGGSGS